MHIGHGKLLLGDGGYYEGAFDHGEIEGHGYRVFGLTGATYSGQFHRGEMHGQGLLQYPSGEQYEGTWAEGRKEGMICIMHQNTYNTVRVNLHGPYLLIHVQCMWCGRGHW